METDALGLLIVPFVGEGDGLPPAWLGQDVIALDPTRSMALVCPRGNTAHWCAQAGWVTRAVEPAECPFDFGRFARVEWDAEEGSFRVRSLRGPFGPTAEPGPYFGLGAQEGIHDFWGQTAFAPKGVVVSYQIPAAVGDGAFMPQRIREFGLDSVEEARAFFAELLQGIDIAGLGLKGVVAL